MTDCKNCLHVAVCARYSATGGMVRKCQHFAADIDDGNKWIPVTERLPKESGQYIVCCDDSGCYYGEGIWYQSGVVVCAQVDVGVIGGICWEWYECHTLYDLEGVVTHWMPLPEAPKGEDDG